MIDDVNNIAVFYNVIQKENTTALAGKVVSEQQFAQDEAAQHLGEANPSDLLFRMHGEARAWE